MGRCNLCAARLETVSQELGICLGCIRTRPKEALAQSVKAHGESRRAFGLPVKVPKDPDGVSCKICVNECRIAENQTGFCGLRKNEGGRLKGVSAERGKLSWYHDPLPTNCVGDWVCAGGTGAGFPQYAYSPGAELGHKNLAVFFHACSFNCLFCQNWQFKEKTRTSDTRSVHELVDAVDGGTSCVCYFGGDPAPQLPFSIKASELAMAENQGRILRFCWETNGSMNERLLNRMVDLAIVSGGCIKFDLKTWDDNLHKVLTGVTNRRTLENFAKAAERCMERPVPPLLIANTLLVPGYIDEVEVRNLADFIASLHPDIPYSLLGYYPHFYMADLPLTSKDLAHRCLSVARKAGLNNVRMGNVHLFT